MRNVLASTPSEALTTSERVPLSVPTLRGREWAYVKECLDTGWVSSAGPFVERFEREIATYTGSAHAVAVVNGTAGLHVALRAVGGEPGGRVRWGRGGGGNPPGAEEGRVGGGW